MRIFIFTSVFLGWLNNTQAQSRLHLDLQLGAEYPFVENTFFSSRRVVKTNLSSREEIAAPMLRWQGEKWSVSTGYSGGNYGWGYRVKLPKELIRNPYGQRMFNGGASSAYAHRLPVLVSRRLASVNIYQIDEEQDQYLLSFRLEGVVGGGLQFDSRTCLDCGRLGIGGNGYDSIQFTERPYWRRAWGGYLTAGATARFYRRGKERLTLRLLVSQGLQDMIIVPLDYSYNGRRGSTILRVRGSGVSLTLGYPLRLYTARGQRPE